MALFLLELYRSSGDPKFAHTALGGIRFALADAAVLSQPFSFFAGRIGVARTLVAAAVSLERHELLKRAVELITPLVRTDASVAALDVVGGAAGCIPHLLQMQEEVGGELCLDLATRLGEEIIRRAVRQPIGWSWGDPTAHTHARHLCGMAHGAAGIGHSLAELFHATGNAEFRYAAELAFAYEDQFFDPEVRNWPDFRSGALGKLALEGRLGHLAEILANEGIASLAYRKRYMNAWCHGAPGILLTRLRASELFHSSKHRARAEQVLPSCSSLVAIERLGSDNFSLCHGLAGNAEALLVASDKLTAPELREQVRALALRAAEMYELRGLAWPCGTVQGIADPSLLLGESGVGYFYLRLHDPAVPSLLLPEAPRRAKPVPDDSELRADTLRSEYVDVYFASTRSALKALTAFSETSVGPPGTEILQAERTLDEQIARVGSSTARNRLLEVFAFEKSRLGFVRSVTDYTQSFLRKQLPPPRLPQGFEDVRFSTAPHVRAVVSSVNCEAAFREETTSDTDADGTCHYYLLSSDGPMTHLRRLGSLAGLVLCALQDEALTLPELYISIEGALDESLTVQLRADVCRQLDAACRARVVEWNSCEA